MKPKPKKIRPDPPLPWPQFALADDVSCNAFQRHSIMIRRQFQELRRGEGAHEPADRVLPSAAIFSSDEEN
jgi:hypothetical protein